GRYSRRPGQTPGVVVRPGVVAPEPQPVLNGRSRRIGFLGRHGVLTCLCELRRREPARTAAPRRPLPPAPRIRSTTTASPPPDRRPEGPGSAERTPRPATAPGAGSAPGPPPPPGKEPREGRRKPRPSGPGIPPPGRPASRPAPASGAWQPSTTRA